MPVSTRVRQGPYEKNLSMLDSCSGCFLLSLWKKNYNSDCGTSCFFSFMSPRFFHLITQFVVNSIYISMSSSPVWRWKEKPSARFKRILVSGLIYVALCSECLALKRPHPIVSGVLWY